jgi:hypothetical protein
MTIGVGRGMNLNFATLATLLRVAQGTASFDVGTLADLTGFHQNKVKGHQSWARVMGLIEGTRLTPLAHQLLEHDPLLTQPLSRGVCYIEIASNPQAEVAYHICRTILPRIAATGASTSNAELVVALIADGVGSSADATGQPKRDADLFLASLRSVHAFRPLGLLHEARYGRLITGTFQLGPELTGYALMRCWPADVPYLRMSEAHKLTGPLLLGPTRFADDLAVLEQRGVVRRVTSSGLDQVRPIADDPVEVLWQGK